MRQMFVTILSFPVIRLCILGVFVAGVVVACNNPFATRTPEEPPAGGAVLKPPNSAENVLYNLDVSFDSLSIQDFLGTMSEDFVFVPDPDDSLEYETDFRGMWDKIVETDFANNFFITVDSAIRLTSQYEYKPGGDYYEYLYTLEIKDEGKTIPVIGRSWLYLREYDGSWYIYLWVDHKIQKSGNTWGVIRALYN